MAIVTLPARYTNAPNKGSDVTQDMLDIYNIVQDINANAAPLTGESITGATITSSTITGSTINTSTVSASTLAASGATTLTTLTTSGAATFASQTTTGAAGFGAITAVTYNGNAWTTGTGTITLATNIVFTCNATLTLSGTNGTTMTFPSTSATIARTDAANTFTGTQTIGVLAVTDASTVTANSASAALTVTQTGAGNAFVVEDSASTDTTPFLIDTAGNVVVGYTAAVTTASAVAATAKVQTHGLTNSTTGHSLFNWSSTAARTPSLNFMRSNSNTIGTQGIIGGAGSSIGMLSGCGDDGTAFIEAARIEYAIDATPGVNDMPGRILFSTTADGAAAVTERMRISSAGLVSITGTQTVSGGFGCNTKSAQTAYASGGALNAYGAGVNGLDSGANMSALHAMVVSIRAALVANGIMS